MIYTFEQLQNLTPQEIKEIKNKMSGEALKARQQTYQDIAAILFYQQMVEETK